MDARSLLRAKRAERLPTKKVNKKRQADLDVDDEPKTEKKRKSDVNLTNKDTNDGNDDGSNLPNDFFDDDNKSEQLNDRDDNDDDNNGPSLDDELIAFDKEMENLDKQKQSQQKSQQANPPTFNVFANATITADPVMNDDISKSNQQHKINQVNGKGQNIISEEQKRENEEEKLRRIRAYENEEYMERLEEEARAQEEGDERVNKLKKRMEELKSRKRK